MATLAAQLRNLFARELEVPERREPGAVSMRAVDVSVDRGQRRVLESVSLDVRVGEVLALVGPNGAGKSTLLAAMAGDQDIAAGHVELDGRPLDRWTGTDMAQRRAVLPQQHTVGFSFTSLEVVRMGRAPWVRTACRDEDADAVREAMEACDVARFAERPFAALSGGERSRVALARVFAQRTETLLLDEPTAALDLGHQEAVMSLVRERARAGTAVVVVLHDLALAAAYADTVAVLEAGALAAYGSPREVLTEDLLSRVYGHPVEVIAHPRSGAQLVLPQRD
ncbi:heme ABC transporter ATP-binding protein [Rhodococcus oryzae]|uniref:Heme ABC transporter ATP-binding protein n=1 Tax=Rhodococcus oryzae TaxID=2571143 RepID=A0ABY2RL43_9NOCA|nr:heme ABC transporter ATP-binding protein [Rhodococcus oryzae]TJZ78406.1 heme ABC transporter ATP-binding protein [Rhodococcus oryzae]